MPAIAKKLRVTHDVLQMLEWRVKYLMMLVKSASAAFEQERNACIPRPEAKVRILRAIAIKGFIKTLQVSEPIPTDAENQ